MRIPLQQGQQAAKLLQRLIRLERTGEVRAVIGRDPHTNAVTHVVVTPRRPGHQALLGPSV